MQMAYAQDSIATTDLIKPQLCVIKDHLPLQDINNGVASGIIAELIDLINTHIATPFNMIASSNDLNSLQTLALAQCDATFVLINENIQKANLIYSKTIIDYPLAMAVLLNTDMEFDLSTKKDATFAIDPNNLRDIDVHLDGLTPANMAIETGIAAVSMGAIHGFIDSMPILIHHLENNRKHNIKVVELALAPLSLKIAMRPSEQVMMNQVNDIIDTMPEHQIIDIEKKWLAINYQVNSSNKIYWLLIFIPLLVILFFKLQKDKSILSNHLQQATIKNKKLQTKLTATRKQENKKTRKSRFAFCRNYFT